MIAIAIFSADPAMRRSLEQLLREHSALSIVGVVDDPAASASPFFDLNGETDRARRSQKSAIIAADV